MKIEQYGIYYINLDPTVGREIKKKRPCIVLTPTELNQAFKTVIIAPITSKMKDFPTRLKLEVDKTKGEIMLDQIRTVDEKRIIKKFGELKDKKEIFL